MSYAVLLIPVIALSALLLMERLERWATVADPPSPGLVASVPARRWRRRNGAGIRLTGKLVSGATLADPGGGRR